MAVKTPLELLSKSTLLSERRQQLENKVINLEVEVFNLEEKYRRIVGVRLLLLILIFQFHGSSF